MGYFTAFQYGPIADQCVIHLTIPYPGAGQKPGPGIYRVDFIVKIELRIEGKHKYTDYLSLYKFNEGWKIVSKIYCDHDRM